MKNSWYLSSKILLLVILFIFSQCAFTNARNRPVTTYLDEVINIKPESTVKRVIVAPIAIPVGLVTLTSDIVIIHPLSSLYPASEDAYEYIWVNPSGGPVVQVFLFIPKLVFTPPFILLDALFRSLFDVRR
jgi:hypothetical protein